MSVWIIITVVRRNVRAFGRDIHRTRCYAAQCVCRSGTALVLPLGFAAGKVLYSKILRERVPGNTGARPERTCHCNPSAGTSICTGDCHTATVLNSKDGKATVSGEPGDLPDFPHYVRTLMEQRSTGALLLQNYTGVGRKIPVRMMLLLLFLVVVAGCRKKSPANSGCLPTRIVSLAPSCTETLFALGLGDRVVGVTSYCLFPPEAATREVVGGYTDANLEKIISLHPDLVVLSPEHEKQRHYLEQFSIPVLVVAGATCADVCTSFVKIGRRCGADAAADSLVGLFRDALAIDSSAAGSEAPAVLFCVGRDAPGGGSVTSAFVAGPHTFYDDLLRAAGARNAFTGGKLAFTRLSLEGLLAASPDIIVDCAPAMEQAACSTLVSDWQSLDRLPAVKKEQVHCIVASYATLPGPRLLLLLDELKKIVRGARS